MTESRSQPLLLADVGGTNARFALTDADPCVVAPAISLRDVASFPVASFDQFEDVIAFYLAARGLRGDELQGACLAVASPVGVGEIRFTNSPWRFSRTGVMARFGLRRLDIVNDFEALAWQVPHSRMSDLHVCRAGIEHPAAPRVVLGPGTGLGVAGLVAVPSSSGLQQWRPVPGEGGHVAFAPTDDFEIELLKYLQGIHGRVSIERIVSGPGLAALHRFVLLRHGGSAEDASPEVISQRASVGSDRVAQETVRRFLAILGGFAGDVALTFGAIGGVYLGGGILPRLEPLMANSEFYARFNDKGRYARWVAEIPIRLIVDDHAALRGAAIAFFAGRRAADDATTN